MKNIIVRIPPSPTGWLHLGTARTALFNILFAKKQDGKVIFRWEDTDKERSKTEFEDNILEGFKWMGIEFEEFYRQTDQADRHAEVLEKLWQSGHVFPCFCTPEEVDVMRTEAQKQKTNFVFWSPFRELEKSEAESKMKTEKYVWRLRVPKGRDISFEDQVRGTITVNTDTLGDFVVARQDGSVLYPLANVVDDMDQGVTHIMRGEDGISNTPKQRLLFEALGADVPTYAHIPLVLDHKKKKLSKRNVEPGTCVLIKDFEEAGFLPEAVVNGLAFLGWNPKTTTDEIFSFDELVELFDVKGINPAGSQYDFEKMRWFNGKWMNTLSIEELQKQYLAWANMAQDIDANLLHKSIEVAREKAKTFVEMQEELSYLLDAPMIEKELLLKDKFGVDESVAETVLAEVQSYVEGQAELPGQDTIKESLVEVIQKLEMKNGTFLWPLRTALSGKEKSASPFSILYAIGKEESLKRIQTARALLA